MQIVKFPNPYHGRKFVNFFTFFTFTVQFCVGDVVVVVADI